MEATTSTATAHPATLDSFAIHARRTLDQIGVMPPATLDAMIESIRSHGVIAGIAELSDTTIAMLFPTFGGQPPAGCDGPTEGSRTTTGPGEHPVTVTVLSWDETRILELHRQDFRLGVEARMLMLRNRSGGEPSVIL
jgi:hypothetical protein